MTTLRLRPYTFALLTVTLTCLTGMPGLFLSRAEAQQEPSPDWVTTAAEQLRAAHGAEWLAARDAALARPNIEVQALLIWLTRPDGSAADRTVSLILRARLEHPAVAQEYDNAVARSLSDPEIGRHGGPLYHATMPMDAEPANWPFATELMWKRSDLPKGLRWAPYLALSSSPHIEPMLVILAENPDKGGELAAALTSMVKAHPDPRVIPALLNNYRYVRDNNLEGRGHVHRVMAFTATLETAEAAAAVLQMREIERAYMQAHGWAPWNDADAEEDLNQAGKALALAKHNRSRSGNEEPVIQAQQQYDDALERKQRRWLWEQIEHEVNELRAKGLIR